MSEKKVQYVPPEARLGDTVFWFPGGTLGEKPQPAVVTEVGRDALAVAAFQPLVDRLVVRDSVRHVDDPRPRLDEVFYAGAWCHRADYFARPEVSDELKAQAGSREAERAVRERGAKA